MLVVGGSAAFVVATFVATDARFRLFAIGFAERLPTSLLCSYDWNDHGMDDRVGFWAETPSAIFAEWGAHYGVYVTALAAMGIVAQIYVRRVRRSIRGESERPMTAARKFANVLRVTARPAIVAGLLLLLLSLALAAQWISCLQRYYETDLARLVDSNGQWKVAQRIVEEFAQQQIPSPPPAITNQLEEK
jgi:hypothetical protein